MDAGASTTSRPKRWWRPRFSLRTLVLFVLTVGSGGTLWWNWGPWGVAYVIQEKASIVEAGFSPDGNYVYTRSYSREGDGRTRVAVRRAEDGKIAFELLGHPSSNSIAFSSDLKYVMFRAGSRTMPPILNTWRLDGSQAVPLEEEQMRLFLQLHFSSRGGFLVYDNKIIALPDFRTVKTVKPFAEFSHDEKHAVYLDDKEKFIHVLSLPSGREETQWKWDDAGAQFRFSPDDKWLAVYSYDLDSSRLAIYNLETMQLAGKYPGSIFDRPFSSDSQRLATHDNIGHMIVWDVQTHRQIAQFNATSGEFEWQGDVLFSWAPLAVFNGRTGEKIWEANVSSHDTALQRAEGPPFPMLVLYKEGAYPHIVRTETGQGVIELSDWRCRKQIDPRCSVSFNPVKPMFICAGFHSLMCLPTNSFATSPAASDCIPDKAVVFHLTRPERWYGVAWLPEFWITVVCAGGLVWSVCRRK